MYKYIRISQIMKANLGNILLKCHKWTQLIIVICNKFQNSSYRMNILEYGSVSNIFNHHVIRSAVKVLGDIKNYQIRYTV